MPILDPNAFEFISRSTEQTRRVGIRLGAALQAGDVICLNGELGAGKTTLTQGIAQGWGSLDRATSPTFVIVKYYRRANGDQMYHLDAYRLENALEADDLDIDQMISTGPFVAEWAERIEEALPEERIWIEMAWLGDEQRSIVIKPVGERNTAIVNDLKKEMIKSF
jgi:tRNA threonylcarbamoyladenosine biosynthesis protein TsaE